MGAICSVLDKEESPVGQEKEPRSGTSAKLQKKLYRHLQSDDMEKGRPIVREPLVTGQYCKRKDTKLDGLSQNKPLVYANDGSAQQSAASASPALPAEDAPPLFKVALKALEDIEEIAARNSSLAFDYEMTQSATPAEQMANARIEVIKRTARRCKPDGKLDMEDPMYRHSDQARVFDDAAAIEGREQRFPRFQGDHFLTNADLITRGKSLECQSNLFRIARRMPKAAHLHIHFNACLLPQVLLGLAEEQDCMFIRTNLPLTSAENLDHCEVQFCIFSKAKIQNPGNVFDAKDYDQEGPAGKWTKWMKYTTTGGRSRWPTVTCFLSQWDVHTRQWGDLRTARDWLVSKLVFSDEEAHNEHQTQKGAWELFGRRTRMMKGLFNYRTAFTKYTRLCLDDFVEDNIQYAEIRPNFMQTNQIWEDDGEKQIDNAGTMDIIADQCNQFLEEHSSHFIGIKVIYGTPRVFTRDQIKKALDECLEFKKNPKYGHFIAGFDLMGPEHEGKPLSHFVNEFLEFKENCRRELGGKEIPFLFHAGEGLEDPDKNLDYALALDSKRIGHGFALPGKPYLMVKYKERNICVETCPISNQVLGLASRQRDHKMYDLLANNVHCTVNSDNGTLFGSSLSHDFYEVMVGRANMNLFGWKQLIQWSIEHSCLEDYTYEYTKPVTKPGAWGQPGMVSEERVNRSRKERAELESMWAAQWTDFIDWINMEFKEIPVEDIGHAQA